MDIAFSFHFSHDTNKNERSLKGNASLVIITHQYKLNSKDGCIERSFQAEKALSQFNRGNNEVHSAGISGSKEIYEA